MTVALWVAAFTGFAAGVISLLVGGLFGDTSGVTAIGGTILGTTVGFLTTYVSMIILAPVNFIGAMLIGLLAGGLLTAVQVTAEPWRLRHIYRRLSERPEAEEGARVRGLLSEIAPSARRLPAILVEDTDAPEAHTRLGAIILCRGLLRTASDDELRAILAHEYAHWSSGDVMGLVLAWSIALPMVLVFNYLVRLHLSGRHQLLEAIALLILWPFHVVFKYAIGPVMAAEARKREYAADAAVLKLGPEWGYALLDALKKLSAWEMAPTGWDELRTAHHPPTELRLEALDRGLNPSAYPDSPAHHPPIRRRRRPGLPKFPVVRKPTGAFLRKLAVSMGRKVELAIGAVAVVTVLVTVGIAFHLRVLTSTPPPQPQGGATATPAPLSPSPSSSPSTYSDTEYGAAVAAHDFAVSLATTPLGDQSRSLVKRIGAPDFLPGLLRELDQRTQANVASPTAQVSSVNVRAYRITSYIWGTAAGVVLWLQIVRNDGTTQWQTTRPILLHWTGDTWQLMSNPPWDDGPNPVDVPGDVPDGYTRMATALPTATPQNTETPTPSQNSSGTRAGVSIA